MKKIIISLDGHSGCGKSTLAKLIAEHLKFTYIDSGAMYRAMTLYLRENKLINRKNELKSDFSNYLNDIKIDFSKVDIDGKTWVRLNDEIVESEIRSISISNLVSVVSQSPVIRNKLISLQQSYGLKENVVMDGRDIGTVVFPNAQLKFWLTASADKRANRRFLEYQLNGDDIAFEKVRENIINRDKLDENRNISPLIKPYDSIEIDNSDLTIDETFQTALLHINKFL
jgi:cytidylate kinase